MGVGEILCLHGGEGIGIWGSWWRERDLLWLPIPGNIVVGTAFTPPETQPRHMPGDVSPAAPNASTLSFLPRVCLPHAAPTALQAEGNYDLWPQHPKQSIEG